MGELKGEGGGSEERGKVRKGGKEGGKGTVEEGGACGFEKREESSREGRRRKGSIGSGGVLNFFIDELFCGLERKVKKEKKKEERV